MMTALYVVILTYVRPIAEIEAALDEHKLWLERNYNDGVFLASGPRDPRVGGIIMAAGVDRAELDARLADDPFARRGLATTEVHQFAPNKYAEAFVGVLSTSRT